MPSQTEKDLGIADTQSLPPALDNDNEDLGNLPLLVAIKKYRKIVIYTLMLAPAIIMYGYDGVIVNTMSAIPVFQHRYGDDYDFMYIIPASWLGAWTAASPIGTMLGAITSGWIHDRFGRRKSLWTGCSIGVVGSGICFASSFVDSLDGRRGTYLVGKLLEGMCNGMVICTTQTYISEIAPHSLRAPSFALFPVFILFGQLLAALVIFTQIAVPTTRGYLTCIASQWAFSLTVFVVTAIIPESPTWLVRKGRTDAACKSERRLQCESVDVAVSIDALVAVLEQEKQESNHAGEATFQHCFTGVNRRRTLIIMFANLVPQLFGNVLLAGASYFFQLLGMKAGLAARLLPVGISVGLVANFLGIWTLSTFGRRQLMMVTFCVCAVLYLGMGISGFWYGKVPLWWALITFMVVIFTAGLGVWPASVLVASETSSLELRGKSQGIGWLTQGLDTCAFSIFLPYIYSPDAGNAGAKTGFLFFGLCIMSAAVVWAIVPEMRGRSQAEIDAMFNSRVPTREWKDWKPESMLETEDKDDDIFVEQVERVV